MSKRVVVAMSGGVDSSVAAALLKEQGFEVIGIMLRLWADSSCATNRCCPPDAVDQAFAVAEGLGIPLYIKDYQDLFRQTVVEYFKDTYVQGMTPNPCLVCNQKVRFGRLLEEALSLGAEKLVTGHYAQVEFEDERWCLKRGVDLEKDQSYVLYRLSQEQLSRVSFPLGGMTKPEVRKLAEKFGLPTASRKDSQDLCFTGKGGYREILKKLAPQSFKPGEIIDIQGNVLGRHLGLPAYTIGQRKGLQIATGRPMYVVQLDMETNRLVVADQDHRGQDALSVSECNWVCASPMEQPFEAQVKLRYTAPLIKAWIEPQSSVRVKVRFQEPINAITPGQAIVFYQDSRVLGGGIIERDS